MKDYETVIGLEVHAELATNSKIFCSCSTQFGGEPNTRCCPVCTGMPGTLPLLNKKVVEYALATGLALNCSITGGTKFDRKNYFYPDLVKAYQISQLYLPICRNGELRIETASGEKTIRIHEIHMEEDAGKLIHDPIKDHTLIDYNRSGVPLIEIVSEPDMRSADEVVAYLNKLKSILQYLGVSDCKMQEGSLRVDINLSVREAGAEEMGIRTEMKNLNSFKAIQRAVEGESKRQIKLLEGGGRVVLETRRWDDNQNASFSMRSKEEAQDYRYFPEPDLPVVEIGEEWIREIKNRQPELPEEKRQRYIKDFHLPEYDATIITGSKHLAELFENTVALCQKPKEVSNWLMVEALRLLKEQEMEPEEIRFTPTQLSSLIGMVDQNKINRTIAKEVFEKLFHDNINPEEYVAKNGLAMVTDEAAIGAAAKRVADKNPQSLSDYRKGKTRAIGFIVGQTMKELKGKADPALVNRMVQEILDSLTD